VIWLLGALGWLRKATQAILGLAGRYPLQCALIASLALAAVLFVRGNRYQAKLSECTAGRVADRKAFEAAAAASLAKAVAAKAAQEARYASLAKDADNAHEAQLADARAAAERYIARNRVRPQAASGSTGGTAAPAESGGPGSADSAGGAPVMVAVTEADIGVCTDNTLRLEAARDWALSLAE
jgi:hypothetical protein